MYDIGKEISKVLITIFIMGYFLMIGWNVFFCEFLEIGKQMEYGTGVGFWIFFYSIAFSVSIMKGVLDPGGDVNIHHHYKHKDEENND